MSGRVSGERIPQINAPTGGYGTREYRETPVPSDLRRVIEVAWSFRRSYPDEADSAVERSTPHTILPETGVSLCFASVRDGNGRILDGRLLILGPIRTVRMFDPAPGSEWVGVRLRPEWCADAFGIHPGEVVDAIVEARRAGWKGAGALEERVLRSSDAPGAARILTSAIGDRWSEARPGRLARLAHGALESLRRDGGHRASVSQTAKHLGITSRHLRRVVDASWGGGMKLFHRVRRLQRAASLATGTVAPRWSAIALEAGFYDQAHMIRDFRALTGMTPVDFHASRGAMSDLSNTIA